MGTDPLCSCQTPTTWPTRNRTLPTAVSCRTTTTKSPAPNRGAARQIARCRPRWKPTCGKSTRPRSCLLQTSRNWPPGLRKATLRRMLLRETFPLELALHRLDSLGSHGDLEHYDFCVAAAEALKNQPEIHPPLLTGDDLLALGISRGKRIGELLHELRDKQLAEEIKSADEARAWLRWKISDATGGMGSG